MLAIRLYRLFSKTIPVVDFEPFLRNGNQNHSDCVKVSDALHTYGCFLIKDPRVNFKDNDKYLDMMERYYQARAKSYHEGNIRDDIFPEVFYQYGATPERKGRLRNHEDIIRSLTAGNEAQTPIPNDYDARWRYFWQIGKLSPTDTQPLCHHVPKGFPEWTETMNGWGNRLLSSCFTVAEMTAIGLGLKRDSITERMEGAYNQLGPLGCDLLRHKKGTIFVAFHYGSNWAELRPQPNDDPRTGKIPGTDCLAEKRRARERHCP